MLLEGNIPSPTINIFGKFPPNTFIPHPMFILLRVNVHPIWLFHTLPLLGTQEYPPIFLHAESIIAIICKYSFLKMDF